MKNEIIKKFTCILLLTIIIFSQALAEDQDGKTTIFSTAEKHSLSSNLIFMELTNIPKTIELLNKDSHFSSIADSLFAYKKKTLEFKNSTGIDLLNNESLKKAGFDINRAAYMSVYYKHNRKSENTFYLPVLSPKIAALNFVKLIKRLNKDNPEADLNPAVNTYKNFKVYQIQPDIFYTFIDGYFILTASGDSIKAVIDLHSEDSKLSLSEDPYYIDFKNKKETDNSEILTIFLKPGSSGPENQANITKKDQPENIQKNSDGKSGDITDYPENPGKKENSLPVNYITVCLKGTTDNITVLITTSTNKENEDAKQFADMIITGLAGKHIKDEQITGYHFLSFDFFKLNNYCKDHHQNTGICRLYNAILKSINLDNFLREKDTMPCPQSFVNIILRKSDTPGEMDHFLVFIPMNECEIFDDLLENITDNLEIKYPGDLSGKERIDDVNSFWFITDDNNKINILEYNKDLYIGNNIDFIKKSLKSDNFDLSGTKDSFYKEMDEKTFLFSNSKFDEESFLKALLIMMAFKENPELSPIISRIYNISLTGKKNDFDYNLILQLNFIDDKKK
ncbi:MAG: hypothetical protein JW864_18705 [Spirochaetes bacterium]|nr:hypothetical protein [Spirochaetota bacterium]